MPKCTSALEVKENLKYCLTVASCLQDLCMHGLSVPCIGLLVLAVSACSLASVCIVEQTYLHCALLDSSTFPQLIVQLAALRTALESDCFLTCALNTSDIHHT